jgi:hypothetical protein
MSSGHNGRRVTKVGMSFSFKVLTAGFRVHCTRFRLYPFSLKVVLQCFRVTSFLLGFLTLHNGTDKSS